VHNKSVKQAIYFDILTEDATINVPADFPTIQAALDSLNNTFIPADIRVKILVEGVYAQDKVIYVDHVQGDRISIHGQEPVQYEITGYSRTANNISFTLDDAAGLAVGDVVLIENVDGTGHYHAIYGSYLVTAMSGDTITVIDQLRHPVPGLDQVTITSGSLCKLSTIIICSDCGGIHVAHGSALGELAHIAFIGDGSQRPSEKVYGHNGIEAGVGSRIYLRGWTVAMGFGDFGCSISGNGTFADLYRGVFCQNVKHGLIITEGAGVAVHEGILVVCQNGDHGVIASGIAQGCMVNYLVAVGNQNAGFINFGANVIINFCVLSHNLYGLIAERTAYVDAKQSGIYANQNDDVYASHGAIVDAIGVGGYLVQPKFNPPINTLGNVNGYIMG